MCLTWKQRQSKSLKCQNLHFQFTSTTLNRNTLDEWSAWCTDLYLTTNSTHNRQTSIPPVGCEPTILASKNYRNTSSIGTYVGKIWTNKLVIMYLASWYLKYNKLYRCVMLKPVAFLILGGYWKWAVSFLLHPRQLHGGRRARIPSNLAVGRLMGPEQLCVWQ